MENRFRTNSIPMPYYRQSQHDCPICGYKQSVSVSHCNERKLVYCHACHNSKDVWQAFREDNSLPSPCSSPVYRQNNDTHGYALRLWEASQPIAGTLAETYLRNRGIVCDLPADLRFLPRAKHRQSGKHFPCMLAAIRRFGKIIAVHRTFLAHDGLGKAPVDKPKQSLGKYPGGAVRLARATESLAISEGIETGVSIMQACKIPIWVAVSSGNIPKLILPNLPLAQHITIAADYDSPGITTAEDAARHWKAEGREVSIALPPKPGTDFNDLLREGTL